MRRDDMWQQEASKLDEAQFTEMDRALEKRYYFACILMALLNLDIRFIGVPGGIRGGNPWSPSPSPCNVQRQPSGSDWPSPGRAIHNLATRGTLENIEKLHNKCDIHLGCLISGSWIINMLISSPCNWCKDNDRLLSTGRGWRGNRSSQILQTQREKRSIWLPDLLLLFTLLNLYQVGIFTWDTLH